MPEPALLASPPTSMRTMDGDTVFAMAITLCPDELTLLISARGRTATFSTTGFSTTSPASPPDAATKPRDSAEPMRPATTATAHVLVADPSDAPPAGAGGPFNGAPSSDG